MAETALPRDATARPDRPVQRRWRAEVSAIAVIAHRDFVKLLRDRVRLVSELSFPLILVLLLGPALQSGFGRPNGLDLTAFVFTGVLAQTIWQSSVLGLVSLISDREEDFSQEIFVSPVSRYSIVAGKIIGEALVALPTGLGVVVVGLLIGVPLAPVVLLALIPVSLVVALYGGAFGLIVLSNLKSQRTANQVFSFILLPQFFLAGVFNPIHDLPLPLAILSALSPLRYAVELMRNVVYGLQPGVPAPATTPISINAAVIAVSFLGFLVAGTFLFVRSERNR
ncbi:MAG TPA: ABC transporter permease [Candidatus Limnocylindrales bacterium]|nr:ABC transporter permease [Candidatus Limnocylindrales bacterium]